VPSSSFLGQEHSQQWAEHNAPPKLPKGKTDMAKKHDIIVPIILARIHEDGMSFDDASASAKGYYRKSVAELQKIRRDDRAARTHT